MKNTEPTPQSLICRILGTVLGHAAGEPLDNSYDNEPWANAAFLAFEDAGRCADLIDEEYRRTHQLS